LKQQSGQWPIVDGTYFCSIDGNYTDLAKGSSTLAIGIVMPVMSDNVAEVF